MFSLSGKKYPVVLPNRCGSHLREFLLNFCLSNLTGMGANKVVELKILTYFRNKSLTQSIPNSYIILCF